VAIQNWFRICKPGGHVIIVVPHRDLYEKRQCLPSRWNGDHKTFYLPETTEPPDTLSFRGIIERALPDVNLVSFRILDESWISESPDVHSAGEYSIEAIIKK
jgi:SAM-dependent methyltransferase